VSYSIGYVALVAFLYLGLQEYFEDHQSALYVIAAILLITFLVSAILLFSDMRTIGDKTLFLSAVLISLATAISMVEIKYGIVIGLIGFLLTHVAGLYVGYQQREVALIIGSIVGLLFLLSFALDVMSVLAILGIIMVVTYPVGLIQIALKRAEFLFSYANKATSSRR